MRTWARRARSAAARPATPRRASRRSAARAGFIGQVAPDQLGEFYRHDLTAAGVEFITPADRFRRADRALDGAGHARRASDDEHLPRRRPASAGERARRGADRATPAILYLEGYLWDPETPRYAMVRAIEVARGAGRKVAFTLSDSFCIDRHRDGFNALIDDGRIDILFANEAEIQALAGVAAFRDARSRRSQDKVETLVVTRSEKGAIATRGGERADVAAEPVERLVDTTGAGDLFAAGFLAGAGARARASKQSLRLGAIAAAEVIQHYGARPEADLKALAGDTRSHRKRAAPKDRPNSCERTVLTAGRSACRFRRAVRPPGTTAARRRRSTKCPWPSSELCMP